MKKFRIYKEIYVHATEAEFFFFYGVATNSMLLEALSNTLFHSFWKFGFRKKTFHLENNMSISEIFLFH